MLVNDILLEADKEYDLTVPGKYLEKGPDKGLFNKGRKGTIKRVVKQIQKFLNANGYSVGKADGWYGKKTATAVRKFQKDNDLTADGDVGRNTLLAMIRTDQPDLADRPPSAEKPSAVYDKDYVEKQYSKLKKDPGAGKKLFAEKPDMNDALKATLKGIRKAMDADQGEDVKIFNLPMIVNMKNIDMVLKNTEKKIIDKDYRPTWIGDLIKGLKQASNHARVSPKYQDKIATAVGKLEKIQKDKKPQSMGNVMTNANDNWAKKNFNINFSKFHMRFKDDVNMIDHMLTNLSGQTDVRSLPRDIRRDIMTIANKSVEARKISKLVTGKTAISPEILDKMKDYYNNINKMSSKIDQAREAAGLRVFNKMSKKPTASYSASDDGTKPVQAPSPTMGYKPKKPPVPPLGFQNPIKGKKLSRDPIPSVQKYMK